MYQHGKKPRKKSNPKVFLHAAAVLGVSLIVVAWILHKDLATSTEKKTTVPIVTNVGEDPKDVITVSEPLFSLELPSDWKQTNRVQNNVSNFYEWRSTKKGGDDRRLLLHIDKIPQSYKITRLQPIRPNGQKLQVGNLSENCINFAPKTDGNAPVSARWENIEFVCDPITANQTIGTGTEGSSISTRVGAHTYFFYFEDHNIRPDDAIFVTMLKSFTAR